MLLARRRRFGEFAGALPSGIAMTSAAVDVVRALGEPTTKGGVGRMIWLSYDHMGIKSTSLRPTGKSPIVDQVRGNLGRELNLGCEGGLGGRE